MKVWSKAVAFFALWVKSMQECKECNTPHSKKDKKMAPGFLYFRPEPFYIICSRVFYIFHHDLFIFLVLNILFRQETRSRSQSLIKHLSRFFTLKSSNQPIIWVHCSSSSFVNANGHSLSRSVER